MDYATVVFIFVRCCVFITVGERSRHDIKNLQVNFHGKLNLKLHRSFFSVHHEKTAKAGYKSLPATTGLFNFDAFFYSAVKQKCKPRLRGDGNTRSAKIWNALTIYQLLCTQTPDVHKPPPCRAEQNQVLHGPMGSYPNFFQGKPSTSLLQSPTVQCLNVAV